MNPIDEWWNRNFPAHSVARLLFFLTVSPVMALLVGLTRGEMTRATFSLTTVSGWVVLTIAWYLAREGYGPEGTNDADSWGPRIEPPTTSGAPLPPPPPPPPWNDAEVEATLRASVPRPRRDHRLTPLEVLVSGAMLFVAMSISTYVMFPDDPFTPMSLGLNLVAALLILLVVATSFSLFALLLVAAVAAAPFALMLMLFFLFLGGSESFWDYYWVTAAVAMCFAVGFWFKVRELKLSGRWVKLPLWATSLGASILLVLAAVTATGGDFSGQPAAARPAVPAPAYTYSYSPPPPSPIVGTPHRDGAAQRLFLAWKNGDRAAARTIAHERAIATLFEVPVDPEAYFRGCGFVEGGWIRCVIQTPRGALLLWPELSSQESFYIDAVERVPVDYPVDFERYAQMISGAAELAP